MAPIGAAQATWRFSTGCLDHRSGGSAW
jgi:hypothetical protein